MAYVYVCCLYLLCALHFIIFNWNVVALMQQQHTHTERGTNEQAANETNKKKTKTKSVCRKMMMWLEGVNDRMGQLHFRLIDFSCFLRLHSLPNCIQPKCSDLRFSGINGTNNTSKIMIIYFSQVIVVAQFAFFLRRKFMETVFVCF